MFLSLAVQMGPSPLFFSLSLKDLEDINSQENISSKLCFIFDEEVLGGETHGEGAGRGKGGESGGSMQVGQDRFGV